MRYNKPMKTIQQDMKEENFRSVYLIYGEESFLRRSYKNRLKEAMVGMDEMNFHYAEGKEADMDEVISLAETMPFFAERRLIVLENTGWLKKDSSRLSSYLPQMPSTTHLVFVEREIDKRNALYKKISTLGHVTECKRQSGDKLKNWVNKGFSSHGKEIDAETLVFFLNRVGEDMETICTEIEKLVSYIGDGKRIVREDIEKITTEQITNQIFQMLEEVSFGRRKKALALYEDLLALKEPPMRILFLLTRQFHQLLLIKELHSMGADKNEIASKGKIPLFAVGKYLAQARRFSRGQLEEAVELALEMDQAIKQGKLKDQLAVELLIVSLSESEERKK